jgi:hypothetical protein
MEHALHLAAKHFVEDVLPTSSGKLLNKVKVAMANAVDADEALDLDVLNTELNSIEAEMLGDEASEDREDGEFDVADTIGKALALIMQV